MSWEEFVKKIRDLPVIDSKILFAGLVNPAGLQVQLSRWHKSGKLIQAKRGIYLPAEPYSKVQAYGPYLACLLKRPSYVSLEKALEYYDLIPEAVSTYTCVTTKRQARFSSEAGNFQYRHIDRSLFWGYVPVTLNGQTAFIATPEKAIIDLLYLNKIRITPEYLKELRLQNVGKIRQKKLIEFAQRFNKPEISRAVRLINEYIKLAKKEERPL